MVFSAIAFPGGADRRPKGFPARPGSRREWDHGWACIFLNHALDWIPQLIAGQPVALGGNNQKRASARVQEFQQLAVARLRRNVDVNQRKRKYGRWPLTKIRVNENPALLRHLFTNTRVAGTKLISQNDFSAKH